MPKYKIVNGELFMENVFGRIPSKIKYVTMPLYDPKAVEFDEKGFISNPWGKLKFENEGEWLRYIPGERTKYTIERVIAEFGLTEIGQ